MAPVFRSFFKLLLVIFYTVGICSEISDFKQCADDHCEVPIAKGVTTQGYKSIYKDVMSFGANAEVIIYSKGRRNGTEVSWVKLGSLTGYIPIKFIKETGVLQKNLINVSLPNDSSSSPIEPESPSPPSSQDSKDATNEAASEHVHEPESTVDEKSETEKEINVEQQEMSNENGKANAIEEPDPGGSNQQFNGVHPSFSSPSLHHTPASSLSDNSQQTRLSDVDTPSLPNMLSTAHISVPDQNTNLIGSETLSTDDTFVSDGQKYTVIDGTTLPSFDDDENDALESRLFPPSSTDAPDEIPYTQPTPNNIAPSLLDTTNSESHSESIAQRTETTNDNLSDEHEVNVTPTSSEVMMSSHHIEVFSRSLLSLRDRSYQGIDESSDSVSQTAAEDGNKEIDGEEEEEKKGFFDGVKGALTNLFSGDGENDTVESSSMEDKRTAENVNANESPDSGKLDTNDENTFTNSESENMQQSETVENDLSESSEPGKEVASDATATASSQITEEEEESESKEEHVELKKSVADDHEESSDSQNNRETQHKEIVESDSEKEKEKTESQEEEFKEPLKTEDTTSKISSEMVQKDETKLNVNVPDYDHLQDEHPDVPNVEHKDSTEEVENSSENANSKDDTQNHEDTQKETSVDEVKTVKQKEQEKRIEELDVNNDNQDISRDINSDTTEQEDSNTEPDTKLYAETADTLKSLANSTEAAINNEMNPAHDSSNVEPKEVAKSLENTPNNHESHHNEIKSTELFDQNNKPDAKANSEQPSTDSDNHSSSENEGNHNSTQHINPLSSTTEEKPNSSPEVQQNDPEGVANNSEEETKDYLSDASKASVLAHKEATASSFYGIHASSLPKSNSPQSEPETRIEDGGNEKVDLETGPEKLPNHLPLVSPLIITTESTKPQNSDSKDHETNADNNHLHDSEALAKNKEKLNEENVKNSIINEKEDSEYQINPNAESAGKDNVGSALNENGVVESVSEDIPNQVVTESYELKQAYYESNDNVPESSQEDKDYTETNEEMDFELDKNMDLITMLRAYIQSIMNLIPDPLYSALEELTLKGVSPRVIVFTTLTGVLTVFLVSSGLLIQRKRQESYLKEKVCAFEGKVYKFVAENQVLKEELESNKNRVYSLEEALDEAQSALLPLQDQLKKSKEREMYLETLVTSLQEDLDSSAEAGLTLNKMLSDLLTSQSQSSKLASSIQEVQAKMGAQQEAVQALRNDLARKEEEISVQYSSRLRAEEEVDSLKLKLLQCESQLSETQDMASNYSLECSQLKQQQLSLEEMILQLTQQAQSLHGRTEDLEGQVEQYQTKLKNLEENVSSKDNEIQTLKTALDLVESLKLNTGTDEESEDPLKNLLEVSKATVKLEKADELNLALEKELTFEKENASKWESLFLKAEESSRSLEESNVTLKQEKMKAETELHVLTNYFKETETRMQKELGVQEAWRQQKEEDASQAGKMASDYQQEAALYRAQIKTLKEELENTERSYKNQVATHEKKAHENWLAARAADRKLEETKQESTVLRQRLLLLERELESLKNMQDGIIRPIPKRPGISSDATYPEDQSQDTRDNVEEDELSKPRLVPFSPLPPPLPFPPPFAPMPPPPFIMPPPFRESFGPPEHWKMPPPPPPPHHFERVRRSPPSSNRSQPSPPYLSRNASRQSSPPRRIEDPMDRQRRTFSPGSSSGGRDYGGVSPPPALPHFHDIPPRAYHGPPSPPPHYLDRMPPPPHLQRPHRNHNTSHLHTETPPDLRRGPPDMMTSSPRPRRSASPGSRNGGPTTTV